MLRGLKRTIRTILQYSLVVFHSLARVKAQRQSEVTTRQFSNTKKTGAEVSGLFGTSFVAPNCPCAEVSSHRKTCMVVHQSCSYDAINDEYDVHDDNADYVHESYIPQHSGTRHRVRMWKLLVVVVLMWKPL